MFVFTEAVKEHNEDKKNGGSMGYIPVFSSISLGVWVLRDFHSVGFIACKPWGILA